MMAALLAIGANVGAAEKSATLKDAFKDHFVVGTAVNRYDGSTGWKQHTIDLSAYKGTTVNLGFLGISVYGNDVHVDDISVSAQ